MGFMATGEIIRPTGHRQLFRDFLERRLGPEVHSYYGDRLISLVVFGSVARDSSRPDSDIDFLIVAQDLPQGRMARVREFDGVELVLLRDLQDLRNQGVETSLSPIFKTPAEVDRGSPLFLDMTEDALFLYDHNQYFSEFLDRLRNRLLAQGARRIWRGSAWYWDLKPDFRPGDQIRV